MSKSAEKIFHSSMNNFTPLAYIGLLNTVLAIALYYQFYYYKWSADTDTNPDISGQKNYG